MPITRRTFLTASAALPFLGKPVRADMAIGSGTLTTVSDGALTLPGSFIFDTMPADNLAPLLKKYDLSSETLTPDCNVTLYRDGTNTVLFDVGSGPDFQSTAGQLQANLEVLGVYPEDVTHVVFTHAHPDHIWGLIDDFDEPLFYEAAYMMGRAEWDYWWDPETVNTIGEARAAFAVGAKRRMEMISEQVTFFEGGDEILTGIQAVSSPGHTPGHMSFEVRSGNDAALVLGDAIGNHHVAFARPAWISGSDQDGATAANTRDRLFDRIMTDNLAVAGFHLPGGGMGRVDTSDDGFVFVPEAG